MRKLDKVWENVLRKITRQREGRVHMTGATGYFSSAANTRVRTPAPALTSVAHNTTLVTSFCQ